MMSDLRLTLPGGETIVATEQIVPGATTTAIVLHGFYSSRQSSNVKGAIDSFASIGISSVAPDLYGRGDSNGTFGDLTIAKGVETVATILAYIQQNRPEQKIILTGGSFGGMVALYAAAQLGDAIDWLILRAPVSDWKAIWDAQITPDHYRQWNEEGSITLPLRVGTGTATFKRDFYDEIMAQDIYDRIGPSIVVPTLIVHGTADDVVPLSQSEELDKHIKNSNLIVLDGADHIFQNPAHLQAYQAAIVTFVAAQQI